MRPFLFVLPLLLVACRSEPTADPDPVSTPAPEAAATPAFEPTDLGRSAGRSTVPESDDGVLTVVFFGDSLTAGYGLANPDQHGLSRRSSSRTAREAGLPVARRQRGQQRRDVGGRRAPRRVDPRRYPPDVFVLALGGNDGLRGLAPEATEDNLTASSTASARPTRTPRSSSPGWRRSPNMGADYADRFRAVFPEVAEAYDAARLPFLLDGVARHRPRSTSRWRPPDVRGAAAHRADGVADAGPGAPPRLVVLTRSASVACPRWRAKSEVRSQKSEVRSQKSEVRSQKSEVRSQKSEVRSQKSEVRSGSCAVGKVPSASVVRRPSSVVRRPSSVVRRHSTSTFWPNRLSVPFRSRFTFARCV